MDDEDLTVWCGNLASEVDEELLYELFIQAAPLKRVHIPNDNKSGRPANYAFITFKHDVSVAYAISLLHGTRLYDKHILVRQRNSNSESAGSKTGVSIVLPVRPVYHQKVPSVPPPYDLYERNKGPAGWVPYQKENRRGENKHHRQHNNRGGNWGGHNNRYNDGNEQYGHNNRRRR